jgi:predicted RecA/RadA family phage recombinase
MRRFPMIAVLAALSLFALPAFAQTCVQGKSGVAPTATLTFTAPTQNTDGTAIKTPLAYNLYMATSSGAETKVASALAGSPISVTTGLTPGSAYYFEVTVIDGNGTESAKSAEVCKAFATSVPSTVTITIQ